MTLKTRLFIAIASPTDYYFLHLPSDTKCSLPGSSTYKFVNAQKFLDLLVEKFPGNVRDLSSSVGAPPHILFSYVRIRPADNQNRAPFYTHLTHESMVALIKVYYKYVLAANPTNV